MTLTDKRTEVNNSALFVAIRLAITIRGVVMEKLRRTIFVPVAV